MPGPDGADRVAPHLLKGQEMNLRFPCVLAAAAFAAAPAIAPAADGEPRGIWETTLKIESFGPRDTLPAKSATRVERECANVRDKDAEALLKRSDELGALKGKCWITDSRKEPNRSQVKMTCSDGTTAEAATRTDPDGSLGYMVVFNIPDQGALSITARSKKIAEVCTPEGTQLPAARK